MHTLKVPLYSDWRTGVVGETRLQFNSDLSGEVIVYNPDHSTAIVKDGKALIALVSEYVRRERISQLEQLPDSEVLGI